MTLVSSCQCNGHGHSCSWGTFVQIWSSRRSMKQKCVFTDCKFGEWMQTIDGSSKLCTAKMHHEKLIITFSRMNITQVLKECIHMKEAQNESKSGWLLGNPFKISTLVKICYSGGRMRQMCGFNDSEFRECRRLLAVSNCDPLLGQSAATEDATIKVAN